MSIVDLLKRILQSDISDDKVIDLSDNSQYPASVLSDLNFVFSLGDDSQNMLSFLHGKWMRPTFHWGWDDITHEQAVESEFLQRAFYALDKQNKKRRDAMIASEGYTFIWKNKKIEPVPGIITGEELCHYLTRSREWGLDNMKDINASEERDARRWRLDPTYEDLMAELEKSDKEADYYHKEMGCGMSRIAEKLYCFANDEHVKVRRLNNASYLLEALRKIGVEPILPIKDGHVPLFIPISLENRDVVRKAMFQKEIFCPVHWPLEGLNLRRGKIMAEKELSLIIDQRYGRKEMDEIFAVLKNNL